MLHVKHSNVKSRREWNAGKKSCAKAPARSDSSMMIIQLQDCAKLLELSLELARVAHKIICPGNFAEQVARKS